MVNFQLVSTQGIQYDGEVYEILVPTRAGTIGIFEDHMPLISAASPGVLSVRLKSSDSDSEMKQFAINGGIVETAGNTVRFVADDITASDDINEQEAEAALRRAEELIKGAEGQVALNEAHRLLHHSSAKLHLARLKKRHHR